METRRLLEFLTRLRPEYEVARSQLLMRQPLPSILEALATIRAEETRLRMAGILQQPSSVLAVHTPAPVPTPASAPVAATVAPTGLRCDYCDRSGHTVQYCRQKQKARRSGRTSRGELAPSQVHARVPWSRRTRRCSRCFDALLLLLLHQVLLLGLLVLRHHLLQVYHLLGFWIPVPLST